MMAIVFCIVSCRGLRLVVKISSWFNVVIVVASMVNGVNITVNRMGLEGHHLLGPMSSNHHSPTGIVSCGHCVHWH